MRADNAIIMAAGTSSRFAPLSYERPKALIEVNGEILIERQIRQIKAAGIQEIIIVVGYKAEKFEYLKDKYGVKLIYNPDWLTRNNNASIYAVRDYLRNSYICSSDNYFSENPFEAAVDDSYYAAVFAEGQTDEWCITEKAGRIQNVTVGGRDSWIMLGQAFWSESFSKKFIEILHAEYNRPETADKLWETIYIEHIRELPMRVRKYKPDCIFEFDTLDELRAFDKSYVKDTRSAILKSIAASLGVGEEGIKGVKAFKDGGNAAAGFTFTADKRYKYYYEKQRLEEAP